MWQRLRVVFFLCSIVVMNPLQALAQQTPTQPAQPPQWYGPGPWMMWGDGYGWQFWWICPLMMLFMILVFCAVFFFFMRRSPADGSHHWGPPWRGTNHSAMQILNERFARGEIQKNEYEEKKATILSGG
jgi:putative membrane protein